MKYGMKFRKLRTVLRRLQQLVSCARRSAKCRNSLTFIKRRPDGTILEEITYGYDSVWTNDDFINMKKLGYEVQS